MVVLALILKPITWFAAFKLGTRGDVNAMMLWAAVAAICLTVMDAISVASNLAAPAHLLTLVLYVLMSYTLIPLAWKFGKSSLSSALNFVGILGAFAGVNFTMDLFRGLLPSMQR